MASAAPRAFQRMFEEEAREFYYELGLAVVSWAHIDEGLFDICVAILKAEEGHAAIVYYKTPSIDARLTLVDELVKTILPPREARERSHPTEIERRWTKLKKDIHDELQVRNQLAHSPTTAIVEPRAAEGGKPAGHYLSFISHISRGERLRSRAADKKSLIVDDVKRHGEAVGKLLIRLDLFRERVLPGLLG